jgi:hypothetical protein
MTGRGATARSGGGGGGGGGGGRTGRAISASNLHITLKMKSQYIYSSSMQRVFAVQKQNVTS